MFAPPFSSSASLRRFARLSAAILLAHACSDPSGPSVQAGQVVVHLTTAATNVGAMQFLVRAPAGSDTTALGQPVASSSYTIHARRVQGGTRVIVIGSVAGGELVRFSIPDLSRAANYTVEAEGAADRTTFALLDLAAVPLTLQSRPDTP